MVPWYLLDYTAIIFQNEWSFPVIDNIKKKLSPKQRTDSIEIPATASITNDDSIIVSSLSHNDFLKMLEKNITTFKEDIETSFNKKVAAQLQAHKDSMMEIINQRFTSFKKVIL